MITRPAQVFTIGHSTHRIDEFIDLLSAHGVEALVDVRAFPGSRRHPQFNQDTLSKALRAAGISYHHMVSLGGKRKRESSAGEQIHTRHSPFAAYVAFTKTDEFQAAVATLEELAATRPTAIMCAEALWRNCHRQFISDAMAKDGFAVIHIMPDSLARETGRSPTFPGL